MMLSWRCSRMLASSVQGQRPCVRLIQEQVQAFADRTSTNRHPVLVTLVKADAQAPPLNIQQALKLLRLDTYRRIVSDARDINQVQLWGFYNSSSKTADNEADVWMTLKSIGVPNPQHIYKQEQLEQLERRLSEDASLVIDLAETERSSDNACQTVKSFLQTNSSELLRMTALLETDGNMEQAEGAMQFYRKFLTVVDSHAINEMAQPRAKSEELDCSILQVLSEQEARYLQHLRCFETRLAMNVLWESMLLVRHQVESDARETVSPLALLAARDRLAGHLDKLGVSLHTQEPGPAADGRLSTVIDATAEFRREVRSFALQDIKERKELMTACDALRDSLLKAGVKIQDKKNQASWIWAKTKKS